MNAATTARRDNRQSDNRIDKCFEGLRASGRCALVTYITAGDPDPETTLALMHALVTAGTDIIELGVPFSDPMADGPTIQRASERALERGMSLLGVLEIVRQFRTTNLETPIVLMGYLNPIEAMGYEEFAANAQNARVDGALIVDVPPEEAEDINRKISHHGLKQIFLIAPTSSQQRIDGVCRFASGFVYYVSVKGVTGDKPVDATEVSERIASFRERLSIPIGVGFGIRSPETAATLSASGDAIIVGSAIIEIVERHTADRELMLNEVGTFVGALRDAIDVARAD